MNFHLGFSYLKRRTQEMEESNEEEKDNDGLKNAGMETEERSHRPKNAGKTKIRAQWSRRKRIRNPQQPEEKSRTEPDPERRRSSRDQTTTHTQRIWQDPRWTEARKRTGPNWPGKDRMELTTWMDRPRHNGDMEERPNGPNPDITIDHGRMTDQKGMEEEDPNERT
ncbi:hypothetical protein quinque_001279 [Culex quinquefasciatus]